MTSKSPQNPSKAALITVPPTGSISGPVTTFTFSDTLAEYLISPVEFAQQHPELRCLVAGAIVADSDQRILLIQRSRKDSCPLRWEIPGGSCESCDASLMAAAVRELREESGLCAARILDLIEDHVEGFGAWRKFTFLVQLEDGEEAKVTLDPDEHQDHVWASENDVRMGVAEGRKLDWTGHAQMLTVLRGFRLIKAKANSTQER